MANMTRVTETSKGNGVLTQTTIRCIWTYQNISRPEGRDKGPLLLTWINFSPSMDKLLHPL